MKGRANFQFILLLALILGVQSGYAQWLRTAGDVFNTSPSTPISRFIGRNDRGPMPIDTLLSNASATKGSISIQGGKLTYNPLNGAFGIDTLHYSISIAGTPSVSEQSIAIIGNYNYLVCQDDISTVSQNDTVLIDVRANDFSKYAYNTFISAMPVHGAVSIINNQIQYIPFTNFIGKDSFSYFTSQTSAPFDSAWAWVRIAVCPNTSPIITSSVPQFGGMQLNIVNTSALQLPLYYGIINDTNNLGYGYSVQHSVNSYAQAMVWNTPQMNGTHIGCIYVSDSRGCSSRTCMTSYITNCNPPPSALFSSLYDTINNQLFINAATQNPSTLHQWELSYQSPYFVNPIFTGSNASDSIKNILLPGNYTLMHISSDISMQCADTSIYSFQIQLPSADTFSGYAFTDLNVDGLYQTTEPAAPSGSIVWVANKKQPLFYLRPDPTGYFSIILKSDSLLWGITPSNINTVQTSPIRPLIYHTPKGNGHWNIRGLLFGLHPAAYHVHGRLYIDLNANNSIDAGEPILKNQSVNIKNRICISDSSGVYHYFTSSTNALTITPSQIKNYSANTQNLQPFAGISDYPVDISYIPQSNYFANGELLLTADEDSLFNHNRLYLQVYNWGTDALTGNVLLKYPDSIRLTAVSDSGIIDSVKHMVNWKIKSTIKCATEKQFHCTWYSPNQNKLLLFTAKLILDTVLLDIDTTNNQDTLELIALSHNTNTKWSSPIGNGLNHLIAPWQILRYGICARNPLAQPIVNICVLDTLDKDLSYKTWEYLSSTQNPSSVSFENGVVTIIYNDCFQLPGSNGSIESTFRIKPWPGLPLHKQITNQATIYWDHQQHTHTNKVFHTIEYFLSVATIDNEFHFSIYPNPASVDGDVKIAGEKELTTIKFYDIVGNYIGEEKVSNGGCHIPRKNLGAGTYIIQLLNGSRILDSKTIILE